MKSLLQKLSKSIVSFKKVITLYPYQRSSSAVCILLYHFKIQNSISTSLLLVRLVCIVGDRNCKLFLPIFLMPLAHQRRDEIGLFFCFFASWRFVAFRRVDWYTWFQKLVWFRRRYFLSLTCPLLSSFVASVGCAGVI